MTEANDHETIKENLEGIRKSIAELGKKIEEQDKRILAIERNSAMGFSRREDSASAEAVAVAPPPPPPPPPPVQHVRQDITQGPQSDVSKNNLDQEKGATVSSLEQDIGGKWFARIGIAALVLGLSFFLKYAFDNNWIGETGRVIIGIISGLVLLGLGEKFIRKYSLYAQILTGGGIAVLYLSIFAAYDFYHLINQVVAFLIMILITSIGIALSIRYNAISLIIVSILGGFMTPFLISSGQNNEVGLFSYILLLDLAILAVSIFKKWRPLNIIGFFGTILVFADWSEKYYRHDELFLTMLFLTLFFLVYSLSSIVYNLYRKEKSSGIEQLLVLGSAIAYFAASYALLNPDYHPFMGFFAVILAIYYFLWAYLIRAIIPEDENLYNFSAFLTVGFITLAIPIQFQKNFITIGWAIEAVILFILGLKTREDKIKVFGLIVYGLAIFRALALDSSYYPGYVTVFNKPFFAFITVILASYISALIFRKACRSEDPENPKTPFVDPRQLVAVFLIVANFLTIFIGSKEVAFFWDKKIGIIRDQQKAEISREEQVNPRTKSYVHNEKIDKIYARYYEEIRKVENRKSVNLSIFWLLYGIILLTIGMGIKNKGVRIGGILLFILSILKLVFYDLWELGTLYRIISSISLGVVLLGISFAYQKYKDKIKEII